MHREEDEQEMYRIMEQMVNMYEDAPDFMKETMETVIKIAFHIKELSDEFQKIDGKDLDIYTEQLRKVDRYLLELSDEFQKIDCKDLDIYTEQLRKVDRYLVKTIKATKEITDG